jgi:hypothetical protein
MSQVFEIIPKITSPLAVICFAVYIFYLFKRSDDRKKERILETSDAESRLKVIESVFKDHPDIQISPITEPVAAANLAREMLAGKEKRYNKTLNTLLTFTIAFGLFWLASLIIGKWGSPSNPDNPDPKKTVKQTWAQTESERNKYPYATLSIVQHIKFRDVMTSDSTKQRVAEFRNLYTVYSTRDISTSENIFQEQYYTNSARLHPWPGNERQDVVSIKENSYWVKFDLLKYNVKSIVTGADLVYSGNQDIDNTNNCFGNVTSGQGEWFTCYPNTIDYIDKLIIIIEADRNIGINLPPVATYRKDPNNAISNGEGSCKVYSTNDNCTLTATFEKVRPGECVGFKIRWNPIAAMPG